MPFVFHDKKNQIFGTKNPILNATINYHKLEKGFWLMHSNAQYKENIHYLRELHKEVESDYYLLFIELNKSVASSKNGLIDGLTYENSSWVLLKPQGNSDHCRFKGNETISLALYFTKEWLESNILLNQHIDSNQIEYFLNSTSGLIILPEENKISLKFKNELEFLFNEKIERDNIQNKSWKELSLKFINRFLIKITEENISGKLFEIGHIDRVKILKAEKILLENLQSKFLGIEPLAEMVGLSATKLKANFKLVHGETIFQFFRKYQLESARKIFKDNGLPVKDAATLFGYSNSSKFIAAYKNQFGISPAADK